MWDMHECAPELCGNGQQKYDFNRTTYKVASEAFLSKPTASLLTPENKDKYSIVGSSEV